MVKVLATGVHRLGCLDRLRALLVALFCPGRFPFPSVMSARWCGVARRPGIRLAVFHDVGDLCGHGLAARHGRAFSAPEWAAGCGSDTDTWMVVAPWRSASSVLHGTPALTPVCGGGFSMVMRVGSECAMGAASDGKQEGAGWVSSGAQKIEQRLVRHAACTAFFNEPRAKCSKLLCRRKISLAMQQVLPRSSCA